MSFQRFARAIVLTLCKGVFRVRVRGREKIPPGGAYVIAPSHRSLLDIPFAAFATKRRLVFMAKKELFEKKWMARLFLALGAIPVERGEADRKALRACSAALAAGVPVMVFPEGTRHHGPEIKELFDGSAWLAAKAGVAIVPVGIGGSEEILASGKVIPRVRRVAVVVGDPIPPPDTEGRPVRRADVAGNTKLLGVALQQVYDEARAMVTRR